MGNLSLLRTAVTSAQGRTAVSGNPEVPVIPPGLLRLAGFSQPYFSLSEEARYTEHHHSCNSDLKLTHSGVAFVSAGTSSVEELTHVPQDTSKENSEASSTSIQAMTNYPSGAQENQSTKPVTTAETPMSKMSLSDVPSIEASDLQAMPERSQIGRDGQIAETVEDLFFIDINGSGKPVHTGLPLPTIRRSPSPAFSDSSEEVIIFAGRNRSQTKPGKKADPVNAPQEVKGQGGRVQSKSPEPSRQPVPTVVDDPVKDILKDPTLSDRSTPPFLRTPLVSTPDTTRAQDLRGNRGNISTRKRRQRKRGKRSRKAEEEAEILADYIENTRGSDDLHSFAESSALNVRDLGGSDNAEWENADEEQQGDGALKDFEQWDSADLQDFDDLSTSSESLDIIEQVLLKRERPSGIQYLVVGAGYTMDDARWLPLSALKAPGVDELIKVFEEEQAEFERLLDDESDQSLDTDEQIALNFQEQMDDMEDEKDLEERRKARMADQQIARLLSKQEELGLGSDDLKLFDGEDLGEEDEIEPQLDGIWEGASTFQTQSKSKRKKRTPSSFPSATVFADVLNQDPYNGFDIMDQDRPSLRKRPKGRRGKLPLELSDSELEQQINMAWENDRSKKKQRKQKREELRAQGLLGNKGKPDLNAKYKEGMSMTEVKNEIKDFLMSSKETLPLPPMAQEERKSVHEIANVFKLKSKSIGTGTSRYPVLYKTPRTTQYDEDALGSIEALLSSRRFLPRMDRPKKKGAPSRRGRGGGFATAGVSYRDGEIVGAAAPELGQENRGRAMLEKMGWSTGTALGALNNNSGVVQPIAQVVKTGKAGLG
ncbi:hypothetical protein OEA41_004480 [Lepraria neglecta]|uniref:Protein SQS1 n=1 Tax=Lepraria neglecta TaxID=209136 RepID=A0AAD9YXY2_9LECA|nr:hypothetical protein OEA41_004480 [Lepraria neglecta]